MNSRYVAVTMWEVLLETAPHVSTHPPSVEPGGPLPAPNVDPQFESNRFGCGLKLFGMFGIAASPSYGARPCPRRVLRLQTSWGAVPSGDLLFDHHRARSSLRTFCDVTLRVRRGVLIETLGCLGCFNTEMLSCCDCL